MEARAVHEIPGGGEWQYEPKWDGFRCVAFCRRDDVYLQSKAKPLARYFPEVVSALSAIACGEVVLDGELVVPVKDTFSFDTLLQRLHPAASRVRTLAVETPARYIVFDVLEHDGRSLFDEPLIVRRAVLESLRGCWDDEQVLLSPCTYDERIARGWFDARWTGVDGVMAKLIDAPYTAGERTGMCKVKRQRTADCVVGGFRYGAGKKVVGSLLLGLYDAAGILHHVGFTSTFAGLDKEALTSELEALRQAPGFTGRAPGGPSRWTRGEEEPWFPLRPELVVEVAYDHASEQRFRHGTTLLRRRPDRTPASCRMEQLEMTSGAVLSLLG